MSCKLIIKFKHVATIVESLMICHLSLSFLTTTRHNATTAAKYSLSTVAQRCTKFTTDRQELPYRTLDSWEM